MNSGKEEEDAELETILALSGVQPNAENTDDCLARFFQSWRKLLLSGTVEKSKNYIWNLRQQVLELSDDTPLLFNEHLMVLKIEFTSLIQDTQTAALYWSEIFPERSCGLIGADENPELGTDEFECARFLSSGFIRNEKKDDVVDVVSHISPGHNERKRKLSDEENAPYSFDSIQAWLADIRDGNYDWLEVEWEVDDFGRTNLLLRLILSECTEVDPSILEALDLEMNSTLSIRIHASHLETPTIHPADVQQPTCRTRFLECIASPFLVEYQFGDDTDGGNLLVASGRRIRERLSGNPKRCAVCGEPHAHEIEGAGLYPCQQESCQFVYEDSAFCVVASTLRTCAQAVDLHVRLAQAAANGEGAGRVFEPFPTFLLRGKEIRGRNGIFHEEADVDAVGGVDTLALAQRAAQLAQHAAQLAQASYYRTYSRGRRRHAPYMAPVPPPPPQPAPDSNKDLTTLRKALAAIPSANQMLKYAQSEQHLKDYLQTLSTDLPIYRVLNYVISSLRCRLWPLSKDTQLGVSTNQQYLVASDDHVHLFDANSDSIQYAFHGSAAANWYSILRNGLRVLSGTGLMKNGAVYGKGVYLATDLATSYNYSAQAGQPVVVAICEVVPIPGTNKFNSANYQQGAYIVCDDAERVRLRWLLVFDNTAATYNHGYGPMYPPTYAGGYIGPATVHSLGLPNRLVAARGALEQQLKAKAAAAIRPAPPKTVRENKNQNQKPTLKKTKQKHDAEELEVIVLSDEDGDVNFRPQKPQPAKRLGGFNPPRKFRSDEAGNKEEGVISIDMDEVPGKFQPPPLRRSTRSTRPTVINESPAKPDTLQPSREEKKKPPNTTNAFTQPPNLFSFGGANTSVPTGFSYGGANTNNQPANFNSNAKNTNTQPSFPPATNYFTSFSSSVDTGFKPFSILQPNTGFGANDQGDKFSFGLPPFNPPVSSSNRIIAKNPSMPFFPVPPLLTASSSLYKPQSRQTPTQTGNATSTTIPNSGAPPPTSQATSTSISNVRAPPPPPHATSFSNFEPPPLPKPPTFPNFLPPPPLPKPPTFPNFLPPPPLPKPPTFPNFLPPPPLPKPPTFPNFPPFPPPPQSTPSSIEKSPPRPPPQQTTTIVNFQTPLPQPPQPLQPHLPTKFGPPLLPPQQGKSKPNNSKISGGGVGAYGARQRLMREYKECTEQEELQKLRVSLVDDGLYEWEVVFPAASYLEVSPPLFHDLQQYATTFNREDAIVLRVSFPKSFPAAPPFIRVVRPRFIFHTGHVTIGGSICLEMLTLSGGPNGWKQDLSVAGLLLLLHNLMAVDGKARVDFGSMHHPNPGMDYSDREAKSAFQRVAMQHGWGTM